MEVMPLLAPPEDRLASAAGSTAPAGGPLRRRWPEVLAVAALLLVVWMALSTFLGTKGGPQSRAAQSNLRNGIAAAKVYFTEDDVYTGFDAAAGAVIEPSVTWVDGDAVTENVVNVDGVSSTQVLLETLSESGSSFCLADDATLGTVRGKDPEGGTFGNYDGCAAAEDW